MRQPSQGVSAGFRRVVVAMLSLTLVMVALTAPASAQPLDIEPNQHLNTASPVRGAFTLEGDLDGSFDLFEWTIPKGQGTASWEIDQAGSAGQELELRLYGSSGRSITPQSVGDGKATLYDLWLEPGTYYIEAGPGTSGSYPYTLETTALVEQVGDREPNDSPGTALRLPLDGQDIRGRLANVGDRDFFDLSVDGARSQEVLDLVVESDGALERTLCLYGSDRYEVQCRSGIGSVSLPSLMLAPDDYFVVLSGPADPNGYYAFRSSSRGPRNAGHETEPNDRVEQASSIDPGTTLEGAVSDQDPDYLAVEIDDGGGLWQLDVVGPGLDQVSLLRPDGSTVSTVVPDPASGTATMYDLDLRPGVHAFEVRGGGEYSLSLSSLGRRSADAEREPNDDAATATAIGVGETRRGRLPDSSDLDLYRFSLAAKERIAIDLTPPTDGSVELALQNTDWSLGTVTAHGEDGNLRYDVALPAGDYHLALTTEAPSAGQYSVSLERGDPFTALGDQEPNDWAGTTFPMPANMRVAGTALGGADTDWYRLEDYDADAGLEIRTSGAVDSVRLTDWLAELPLEQDGDVWRGLELPDRGPILVEITASGDYELDLRSGSRPQLDTAAFELPVAMSLELPDSSVAAYWPLGQELRGSLTVENAGTETVEGSLDAVASHHAWSIRPEVDQLALAAGEAVTVPVTVTAPPDAWAGVPVRISARLRDDLGQVSTTYTVVTPLADAEPVGEVQAWGLPEALLGGLDVASNALYFDSTELTAPDDGRARELHDWVAPAGAGFSSGRRQPIETTVDLAGTSPVPVLGTIIHPQAYSDALWSSVREFELLLSSDGEAFTSVLKGELSPTPVEQAFVLPEAVPATAANLRLRSTYGGFEDIHLGEWKVIAEPGFMPDVSPLNIAAPVRGGHIVTMSPRFSDERSARDLLRVDDIGQTMSGEPGTQQTITIGFHEDRAALIDELRWIDRLSPEYPLFESVNVEASTSSPTGPWEQLGTWSLARDGSGVTLPFTPPEPQWARFIRLTSDAFTEAVDVKELPDAIEVIEHPSGADYRSALGEWGFGSPAGPLEWQNPPQPLAVGAAVDDDTPDRAQPLSPETGSSGRIIGTDVDWYRVSVPDTDNSLDIDVRGTPTVRVALSLFHAGGLEVPMAVTTGIEPGTVRYTAAVTPGNDYDLRVDLPPSSVVLTYDTSGSMEEFLPLVRQGVSAFMADVTPGREAVKIVPFEDAPLLDDWTDDAEVLGNALDQSFGQSQSSSTEAGLIDASRELSTREGARAILLVTDAETTTYERRAELWRQLGAVRPLVMAIHVGSPDFNPISRDWMQDYAQAAGGFYQYTHSGGEMDRAFDRLAAWLRRPADYALAYETSSRVIEPGTIAVTGSTKVGTDVAVELILDTSGSMLSKLKGERRIDIARDVLRDLVRKRIPVGTPVAIRVFGDSDVGPCETRLALPLAPLDRATATKGVKGLGVTRPTHTPIAAALTQAAEDLSGVAGAKVIVLITDGLASCGGDPAEVLGDLARRGFDAQVNVVGFSIKEKDAKKAMRAWADVGNGAFFDAKGADALGKSIAKALRAPFLVYDSVGRQVATGTTGGDPVEVGPGTYTVRVLTDPPTDFELIEIDEGGSVQLDVKADA